MQQQLYELDRERTRRRIQALPDDELLDMLLATHKLCELQARGRLREMLEAETVMLTTVLQRFAPVEFQQALDRWQAALDEELPT